MIQMKALGLALLAGAIAMATPTTSMAGTVGYFKVPGSCPMTYFGDPSAAIVAAGHTPTAVAALDAPSLAGLDALVLLVGCTTWSGNTAVNDAVAAGMGLVLDVGQGGSSPSANLPGAPTFTPSFSCPTNTDVASGAPIASGPGGTIDNASFDFGGGLCALVGTAPAAQLPSGAAPFLTAGGDPGSVGAFGYTHGQGRVAYSMAQFGFQLPGNSVGYSMSWAPAASTYFTNALAWTFEAGPVTTCASEGYTGTKLEWCKNICERGYVGGTLAMWVRRWTDRYRTLPYCAVDAK
jgi:hypothetical protein